MGARLLGPKVRRRIELPSEPWAIPSEDRLQPLPLNLDLEVLFYDPDWNVLQVRNDSVVEYILPTEPLPIRAGDNI